MLSRSLRPDVFYRDYRACLRRRHMSLRLRRVLRDAGSEDSSLPAALRVLSVLRLLSGIGGDSVPLKQPRDSAPRSTRVADGLPPFARSRGGSYQSSKR
jgi:hypothetical protein